MTEYDRCFVIFWIGFVVNCCHSGNPAAALGGALATVFGGVGMYINRKDENI